MLNSNSSGTFLTPYLSVITHLILDHFGFVFLRYLSVKVKIWQCIRKCSEKKLLKTIAFPTSLSQMLTMKYERKPKNEPKTN